jgi:hypothetical protein
MAKEVWVFGTKEQVFTQAYKIENSWTIKHYLIDSGSEVAELAKLVTLNVFALTVLALTKNKIISSIFTLPLSCKFLKPLTSHFLLARER